MNQPELWLVRHGETEWSRDGRHTSHTDVPLTATGEAAARRLAGRLSKVRYDLVLTSPLRRAHDTARLCGFTEAEVEPAAVEWDYGAYEGITTSSIRESVPGWSIWSHGTPDGESPVEVGRRAEQVIRRVRAVEGTRVLLFAHAHFLRVLAARWLDQPVEAGAHYRLDTATVSVLGWERETPAISRWNA